MQARRPTLLPAGSLQSRSGRLCPFHRWEKLRLRCSGVLKTQGEFKLRASRWVAPSLGPDFNPDSPLPLLPPPPRCSSSRPRPDVLLLHFINCIRLRQPGSVRSAPLSPPACLEPAITICSGTHKTCQPPLPLGVADENQMAQNQPPRAVPPAALGKPRFSSSGPMAKMWTF